MIRCAGAAAHARRGDAVIAQSRYFADAIAARNRPNR
jgi:hypothetical protein